MYEQSLSELRSVVEKASVVLRAGPSRSSDSISINRSNPYLAPGYSYDDNVNKAKEELRKAMKDIEVFVKITTQLHRKFKRLRDECIRTCKGLTLSYMVEKSTNETNIDQKWAA